MERDGTSLPITIKDAKRCRCSPRWTHFIPVYWSEETFLNKSIERLPFLQALVGQLDRARETLFAYHTMWRRYGSMPEFYNLAHQDPMQGREAYPLRPGFSPLARSFLKNSFVSPWQNTSSRSCICTRRRTTTRFSSWPRISSTQSNRVAKRTAVTRRSVFLFWEKVKISTFVFQLKNVKDHRLDNRMESFFLAETIKYLYLIFDETNFLHSNGEWADEHRTSSGLCFLETSYIFNTEAHPIDVGSLDCCSSSTSNLNENTSTKVEKNHLVKQTFLFEDDETKTEFSFRLDENADALVEKFLVQPDDREDERQRLDVFVVEIRRTVFDLRGNLQLTCFFFFIVVVVNRQRDEILFLFRFSDLSRLAKEETEEMLWQFVKRHRRKLFLLSVIGGGKTNVEAERKLVRLKRSFRRLRSVSLPERQILLDDRRTGENGQRLEETIVLRTQSRHQFEDE